MRSPRRSIQRTAPGHPHEVTLVGVGATDEHPPARPRRRSVIPPSPLPQIEANVLVVPLGSERPSWRQTPTVVVAQVERDAPERSAPRPRTGRPFWATAETVTPRGMLIAASTRLEENQWVVVEIHPSGRPRSAPPLRIKALVNFAMEGVGFGVRFIAMTERTRAELELLTQGSTVHAVVSPRVESAA